MSSALKVINAEVKRLQKKHPGKSRRTLQKEAGKKYREGKIGRISRPKKKIARKRKAVARIKKLHSAEGRAIKSALGSVAQTQSHLKKQLHEQLAWTLFSRDQAKTKRAKKKISKRVSLIRKKLNVL